jgi:hypothetical protein
MPEPFLGKHPNAQQMRQGHAAYQNMQRNLWATPGANAPHNFQGYQTSQHNNYIHNYNTVINNQPVTINSGNTYVNPMPQGNYPHWWGHWWHGGGGWGGYNGWGPGWGWGTGFLVGSILRGSLAWLHWGWPAYYGPAPAGFMYCPNYVPTPWFYNPEVNQWRMAGALSYSPPPPSDYTAPITVQVVEPVQVMAQDPDTGAQIEETINQVFFYNAYYYPEMGRWGYMNRAGYFIWLNNPPIQTQMMVPPA